MKDILKVLKNAVAKDSTINIFKCLHLYGDRIQAQNGRITIDAPIAPMGDLTIDADRFIKAVYACDGEPEVKHTQTGQLSLKKGSFRAVLPLYDNVDFPRVERDADGEVLTPTMPILQPLSKLLPMCGENDVRVWLNGININDGYAYATDGTIMARAGIGIAPKKPINIPAEAIAELIRIGVEPVKIIVTGASITFDLGDIWLRAQLFNVNWPDVRKRFDNLNYGEPVPDCLLENIEKIIPFCIDQRLQDIRFGENGISTAEGKNSASIGDTPLPPGKYTGAILRKALTVATHANFANYPKEIGFKGDNIEGVFMGMRE